MIPPTNLPGSLNNLYENEPSSYNLQKIDTKFDYTPTGKLRISFQYGPQPYNAYFAPIYGPILGGSHPFTACGACNYFEKATRLRPGYGPHLYDYALELSAVDRFDDARVAIGAALKADPDLAEAHELLGGLLAGKRQLAEAAHEYGEAIRLKPEFARAHLDLAGVLADQGEIPAAVEHLRKAAAGSDPMVASLATQALQRIGK